MWNVHFWNAANYRPSFRFLTINLVICSFIQGFIQTFVAIPITSLGRNVSSPNLLSPYESSLRKFPFLWAAEWWIESCQRLNALFYVNLFCPKLFIGIRKVLRQRSTNTDCIPSRTSEKLWNQLLFQIYLGTDFYPIYSTLCFLEYVCYRMDVFIILIMTIQRAAIFLAPKFNDFLFQGKWIKMWEIRFRNHR